MMIDKLMELVAYWNSHFLQSEYDGKKYKTATHICVEYPNEEIEEFEIYAYVGNGVFDSCKYVKSHDKVYPGYCNVNSAIRCWVEFDEEESTFENREHIFRMFSNSWVAAQYTDLQFALNAFEQELEDTTRAAE